MKISIITPTFNSGKYLRETILSVRNQSYKNFEHIVIDGQSSDDTTNIAKEYPDILLLSEKDNGQSDAINKGLRMASGEILAWQNADDLYTTDAFFTVVHYFEEHPEIDVVYGYYQRIDSKGRWICDVYPNEWSTWLFAHGRFCPMQPTVFWRKKVSDVVGCLDENLHYCMDVDFFSRMLNVGFRFARIPRMLGKFRVHDSSKTQNPYNKRKVAKEYKEVLARNFQYTILDTWFFRIFQERAKVAKFVKERFLKSF